MSDLSDSDFEVDTLEENFSKASEHIQRIHANLPPNELLELYGLYKQSTVGRCDTSKPGIFNMQARAKWSAWNDLGDLSLAEAKRCYIEKVRLLDPNWYEALQKGERFKSPHSWVVHSVQMPPVDLEEKADDEKNAFDYVKEQNIARLRECLTDDLLHTLDENGLGLIHWAADRNDFAILTYLISKGVNVDLRDAENQTALHYATSCSHIDCIRILLEAKADPMLTDADGQTCLDIAESVEVEMLFKNVL